MLTFGEFALTLTHCNNPLKSEHTLECSRPATCQNVLLLRSLSHLHSVNQNQSFELAAT